MFDEGRRTIGFLKQTWLVLTLAVVFGGVLALVDQTLQPRIDQNHQERIRKAVFQVVPEGSSSHEEIWEERRVFRVKDSSGNRVGWAVPAQSMGFQDRIDLLVGLSSDGNRILGLAVLSSKETPGLGERIRDQEFIKQFTGHPTDASLEVVRPGQSAAHPIHAISGATISTEAVTRAVNEQLQWFRAALSVSERNQSQEPESQTGRGKR